jgi:hypothetical protein
MGIRVSYTGIPESHTSASAHASCPERAVYAKSYLYNPFLRVDRLVGEDGTVRERNRRY